MRAYNKAQKVDSINLKKALANLDIKSILAQALKHCVNMMIAGSLDPRGVFIARADGKIVGAQVCLPLHGAACLFWLPAAVDACGDALVRRGLEWSHSIGCKLAQALAKPDDMERAAVVNERIGEACLRKVNDRVVMDLWAANTAQLRSVGVTRIEISGVCTLSGDADLWSYRGRGPDGVYGTQLGFIGRLA